MTNNSSPTFKIAAAGKLLMSSEVIPSAEQKMAPTVSEAQSDENVMQVAIRANIEASIRSGMT